MFPCTRIPFLVHIVDPQPDEDGWGNVRMSKVGGSVLEQVWSYMAGAVAVGCTFFVCRE